MIPSLLERWRETHRGQGVKVWKEVKRPVCKDSRNERERQRATAENEQLDV